MSIDWYFTIFFSFHQTFLLKANENNMEKACDGSPLTITMINKTDITSPNYPSDYKNNLNCTWSVISDEDYKIKIIIQPGGTMGEIEEK